MESSPHTHIDDNLTLSIFFTPVFLILTGISLFVALLYGQKDLSVFSLLLLIIASGLKLWSILSIRHIECFSFVDRAKMFPGETVALRIKIENNKFLPVFIKIRLFIDEFFQADGALTLKEESGLLWYQGVTFDRELIAQKRGIYKIGPPSITTGDLFGLFPRGKKEGRRIDILVYPRIVQIRAFPLLKRIIFAKPGATSPVRDPVYILGTRDYQHFSPARHIHWKATARHNRLQEKIFEPAEQDKVVLVLDVERFYENEAFDEFERAIEVLASLATELEAQHYAIGFITNCGQQDGGKDFSPVVINPVHLSSLLEILAKIQAHSSLKMAEVLRQTENLPGDASCIYFSYHYQSGKTYFNERQIPTVHIICETDSDDISRQGVDLGVQGGIYNLKDICITCKDAISG